MIMNSYRQDTLTHTKKILIKIGSAVLTGTDGLDLKIIDSLAQEMCDLTRRGFSIVLVTSGAIASGKHRLNILGKLKTSVQMTAIPLLLYNDRLLNLIDTHIWGYWLLWIAVILTIWSMAYYLQKALPEIRARVR